MMLVPENYFFLVSTVCAIIYYLEPINRKLVVFFIIHLSWDNVTNFSVNTWYLISSLCRTKSILISDTEQVQELGLWQSWPLLPGVARGKTDL